ncbi:MAG: metal-sensitive transcriptional regulator [Clostridiales bacterium]|nr:metal-sensitive transcriptional regulator [Eubacteriales bacterium]MDH7565105.1 metal-sensitive transcriptional regulator [Clostridiales bacterium]
MFCIAGIKENKENILKRLKRIEGQVKGIEKMIENDKNCVDILTQVAAVRAAINKVGGIILEDYSMACIKDIIDAENKEQALQDLTKTIQSFLKFVD